MVGLDQIGAGSLAGCFATDFHHFRPFNGHTPRKFPAFLQQPFASSHIKPCYYTTCSAKNQVPYAKKSLVFSQFTFCLQFAKSSTNPCFLRPSAQVLIPHSTLHHPITRASAQFFIFFVKISIFLLTTIGFYDIIYIEQSAQYIIYERTLTKGR